MEIFKNTNYDFLGKKWPFIIASLVLTVAGLTSMILQGGPRYGIDFRGGAIMEVKFASPPSVDKIRMALSKVIQGEITVQSEVTGGAKDQVLIGTELKSDAQLAQARALMTRTIETTFPAPMPAKGNWISTISAGQHLASQLRDPLVRNGVALSDQQLSSSGRRHAVVSRQGPLRADFEF